MTEVVLNFSNEEHFTGVYGKSIFQIAKLIAKRKMTGAEKICEKNFLSI